MPFLPLRGREADGRPGEFMSREEFSNGENVAQKYTLSLASISAFPSLCVSEHLSHQRERSSTECLQRGGEIWVLQ